MAMSPTELEELQAKVNSLVSLLSGDEPRAARSRSRDRSRDRNVRDTGRSRSRQRDGHSSRRYESGNVILRERAPRDRSDERRKEREPRDREHREKDRRDRDHREREPRERDHRDRDRSDGHRRDFSSREIRDRDRVRGDSRDRPRVYFMLGITFLSLSRATSGPFRRQSSRDDRKRAREGHRQCAGTCQSHGHTCSELSCPSLLKAFPSLHMQSHVERSAQVLRSIVPLK